MKIKKYIVIGNPIEHSLSPKLHNYWFKKKNIDAFYKLTDKIKFNAIDCVGSFMPIRSEISTNKLNKAILDMDKKLAFPTIEKNSETLIFKTTNSLKNFKLGKFNIPEPKDDNKEIQTLIKIYKTP